MKNPRKDTHTQDLIDIGKLDLTNVKGFDEQLKEQILTRKFVASASWQGPLRE